ncbi:MAG: DUF5906 domain-containing protein, partial [Roseibium sp.]|uniref:primase-helicase family protein n=1 Tax=Roseibium sp. TaxID=1936156 RepID=UPI00329A64D6
MHHLTETKALPASWAELVAELVAGPPDTSDQDVPLIADRLIVPISLDALYALTDHFEDYPPPTSIFHLGWDLHHRFGDDAEDEYATLAMAHDGATRAETALQWKSFQRDRVDTDVLLIDMLDEAEAQGLTLPPADAATIERLRDETEARRERRKVAERAWEDARREALETAERAQRQAELDAIERERVLAPALRTLHGHCEFAEALYGLRLAAWRHRWNFYPQGVKRPTWNEEKALYSRYYAAVEAKKKEMIMPSRNSLTASTASEVAEPVSAIRHEDFWSYSPTLSFIFIPNREMWTAAGVNARVPAVLVPGRDKPLAAANWIAVNRPVEQITWAPGEPELIENKLIAEGGWIHRPGARVFNRYLPPTIRARSGDATPWLDHIRYVFPAEHEHIVKWLAHRVQRPDQKVNHALVLGGAQGVGKDTLLEPVKAAIGPWNFSEVSPQQLLGRFNGFLESVVLRISEARDLGDTDRFAFYDHMKAYTAAPPDVLRVDEKHQRERAILNVCGVIVTTNHKSDGIHLPADDRRHFVAWSPRAKDDFRDGYWEAMYSWLAGGGSEFVAHYLAALDLSGFDAKAPPPKTQAFWEIVDAARTPEDAEMADALDRLGRPQAVTLIHIFPVVAQEFREWLHDRRNRRKIPHRFDECGYAPVRNPDAKDGLWVIG